MRPNLVEFERIHQRLELYGLGHGFLVDALERLKTRTFRAQTTKLFKFNNKKTANGIFVQRTKNPS